MSSGSPVIPIPRFGCIVMIILERVALSILLGDL